MRPGVRADPGVQATPDDGTRLSEQRLWDETARPARPAPPPGARYTPAGRAASAELVAVHDMLRAELATVRDLIVRCRRERSTPRGPGPS